MKVLYVTHRYPPRTGGIETHVRELAVRLVERGHDVTVFSADAGGDLPSRAVVDGVEVRRFRSFSPGGAFHVAPQMALAVRRADADVVHAHNYHALPLFFAALGVTDERFVVTTHYHGGSASDVRDVLLAGYRPLGRWAVGRADEVIAVSEWERDQVRDDLGVDATVIPNGIDQGRFRGATPERRERPYLLCVGRLEEYKGVQHVIRALSELHGHELLIAGDGPFRTELEAIAEAEGVRSRIEFLGYVSEERLPALYAGATVYVTLSEFEAFGLTVAEALVSGTPCVVRTTGALNDWTVVEGCVGVTSSSPESIADGVSGIRGTSPSDTSIPNWDDVLRRLLKVYTGPDA